MITCDNCPRQERCKLDPNQCNETLARECVGKINQKEQASQTRILCGYDCELHRRIMEDFYRRYYR